MDAPLCAGLRATDVTHTLEPQRCCRDPGCMWDSGVYAGLSRWFWVLRYIASAAGQASGSMWDGGGLRVAEQDRLPVLPRIARSCENAAGLYKQAQHAEPAHAPHHALHGRRRAGVRAEQQAPGGAQ